MQPVTGAHIIASVMNSRVPFRLYYCVHESDKAKLAITREHPCPWHLLYYVEKGALHGEFGGRALTVGGGECLWVQPGVPFWVQGAEPAPTFTACRFYLREKNPLRLEEDYLLAAGLFRGNMLKELLPQHSLNARYESLRQRSEVARILCWVLHSSNIDRDEISTSGLSPIAQAKCVAFIHQHICERFSIEALARSVQMSPDYFSRQFKKTFGMPPKAWTIKTRIQKAANHLLASDATISEVAYQLGFPNIYLFSRQFRNSMGMSPREWRSQYRCRDGGGS